MAQNNKNKLSSNKEDYLETIYALDQRKNAVRVRDIRAQMDAKKSSVNNAVSVLYKKGLVKHEKYGCAAVADEGRRVPTVIKKT